MALTANFISTCPACNKGINHGDKIGRHVGLGAAGGYVHDSCTATVVDAPQFRQAFGLKAKQARLVGRALGVSRTNPMGTRYGHVGMCWALALAGISATAWSAAVSSVTGIKLTGEAKTEAPQSVPQETKVDLVAFRAELLRITSAVRAELVTGDNAVRGETAAMVSDLSKRVAELGTVREITVKVEGREAHKVEGLVHRQFERLLRMVGAGVNVWLAGPAGSGKTTGVEQVAKALDLPFFFNGAIDTEYKLSGFVDAQGRIVSTAFRKAYTEGGVYLFDEVDASMPGALLAFNAAMANGHCDFPGSEHAVTRHPDFHCVAAGNTWGTGATMEYVGRNRMDAAFLDRFVQLTWGYDETLERALANNGSWVDTVQKLRRKAQERGLKVVISPRASIHGARLLAAGFTVEEALEATVTAKLSAADRQNLGVS